jgi:uncharacterized protein (TIGR02246 family)
MKKQLLVACLLASAFAYAENAPAAYDNEAARPCSAIEQEIATLFDRWNAVLVSGRASEIAKLYADNGILQPTASNKVRTNHEEIRDYFEHFMPLKPRGTINYRQIRVLDENTALDSGVYTFDVVRDGRPGQLQARYTYVYEKIGGEWKIMNHHSSAMPEKLAAN